MSDALSFAWLCVVFAIGGHVVQQLGGRWWVAGAIAAGLALGVVQEGAFLELFDRGDGLVTANRIAGTLLYFAAALLGWWLGRRRAKRNPPDPGA